jgi:hypothetical protein
MFGCGLSNQLESVIAYLSITSLLSPHSQPQVLWQGFDKPRELALTQRKEVGERESKKKRKLKREHERRSKE